MQIQPPKCQISPDSPRADFCETTSARAGSKLTHHTHIWTEFGPLVAAQPLQQKSVALDGDQQISIFSLLEYCSQRSPI